MIRDQTIPIFLRRASDKVFEGRNRTRIVLGTDRKNTINSGLGDGGENDPESGTVDVVAGYIDSNPNYSEDKARTLISAKTNLDEYFGVNKGSRASNESGIANKAENIYLLAQNRIKILIPSGAILIENGEISIEFNNSVNIKCGTNVLQISPDGISLGSETGIPARIITELDTCVGANSAGQVISTFVGPGAIINKTVTIK